MVLTARKEIKGWNKQYETRVIIFKPSYRSNYMKNLVKYCPCGRILEFGCGTGVGTLSLALKKTFLPFLIDFSFIAVRHAKKLFYTNNVAANFIVGDIAHMPFKKEIFAMVHGKTVLEHIPKIDFAVSELYRICENKGIIVTDVPNKLRFDRILFERIINKFKDYTTNSFTPREFCSILSGNGFKLWGKFGGGIVYVTPSEILSLFGVKKNRKIRAYDTYNTCKKVDGSFKKIIKKLNDLSYEINFSQGLHLTIGFVGRKD